MCEFVWRQVEYDLPKYGEYVLVWDGDAVQIAALSGYKDVNPTWDDVYYVTHWMPLPSPPNS